MSLGRGSWLGSSGLVSPGRLFFFSLDVGGWRLDCDHPELTLAPSSNNESATAKNRYERLNLIISTPVGHKRGRKLIADCRFSIADFNELQITAIPANWQLA